MSLLDPLPSTTSGRAYYTPIGSSTSFGKDCIPHQIRVLAPIGQDLTYLHDRRLAPGVRVRVPLSNRQIMGVVVDPSDLNPPPIRSRIDEVLDHQSLIRLST